MMMFFDLKRLVLAAAVMIGGTGLATGDEPKPAVGERAAPKAAVRDGEKPKEAGDQPKKAGEGRGDGKRLVGTITEVNPTAKAMNVSRKSDSGETNTLLGVSPDTKVVVDGKPAKLTDIPKNSLAEVSFKLNPDPSGLPTVTEIRVAGKDRRLRLDKIDGKKLFYQTESVSRSFDLADGVTVVIVGKDAKLSDLKHGDAISATLSTDGNTVLKVVVKRQADRGPRE